MIVIDSDDRSGATVDKGMLSPGLVFTPQVELRLREGLQYLDKCRECFGEIDLQVVPPEHHAKIENLRAQVAAAMQAVHELYAEAPPPAPRPETDLIPWDVKDEHKTAVPYTMLNALIDRNRGKRLDRQTAMVLDRWLKELRQRNVVVAYDPELEPNPASGTGGWAYYHRQPEDGTSIIRRP